MLLAGLALALLTTSSAISQERNDWEELVIERAIYHGANVTQIYRVVNCESRFYPYAINRTSGATGLYQWLPGPYNAWYVTPAYRELGVNIIDMYRRGDPDAPYFDADMGAWSFAHGYASRWSCK